MKKLTLTALIGSIGAAGLVALGNTGASAQAGSDAAMLATLVEEGHDLYESKCSVCHGHNGEGIAGPELAGNQFVASSSAIINQILEGNTDHGMPPFRGQLTARQIAAIATYVRNSWGNEFGIVTEETVANNM